MKVLGEHNVEGRRVLVRCDFNVSIDEDGSISDDFRIQKTLPTIRYLIEHKAKIILMSHLGRPKGQVVDILKLDRVKERLEELLDVAVIKTDDCIGEEVSQKAMALEPGQILLLENLRFHKEEGGKEPGSLDFAKQLAALGEIYINDAFGDCHRPEASIALVPQFLPSGAGLLLQSEVENLDKILKTPAHPLVVLVGGAKVETKAKFIENISKIADSILIGGLIKKELIEKHNNIIYNVIVSAPVRDLDAPDIDSETIKLFQEKISTTQTIVWNGPFGKFEDKEYEKGTLEIAKAIVASGAFSVVGGGQTIEFLRKEGMLDKFSHVSTGGGAMLSYLAGEELPGLKALEK